jgi:hypothetical protein
LFSNNFTFSVLPCGFTPTGEFVLRQLLNRDGMNKLSQLSISVSATIHRPARGVGSAGAALQDLQFRHLLGARLRRFHVEGGRSRTFSSDTSREPAVDVFTLMVGALGPSALAPPGGPQSMFSC